MDVHFDCTLCGRCCRGHKLPLTVREAIRWLRDGHPLQVLCDLSPWPLEPPAEDLRAAHRRRRSFAAVSGALPVRVIAILVADLGEACPNLLADLRCAIHDRRPLVCRVYPAEINPFVTLEPAAKLCPPEAWQADRPLLERDGRVVDEVVRRDIQASRDTDAAEVPVKARACARLGLDAAALAHEGFVVHAPDPAALLAALEIESADATGGPGSATWRILSNRAETVASLSGIGALSDHPPSEASAALHYLGFYPASP